MTAHIRFDGEHVESVIDLCESDHHNIETLAYGLFDVMGEYNLPLHGCLEKELVMSFENIHASRIPDIRMVHGQLLDFIPCSKVHIAAWVTSGSYRFRMKPVSAEQAEKIPADIVEKADRGVILAEDYVLVLPARNTCMHVYTNACGTFVYWYREY